jgi:hypothetical protein
MQASSSAVPDDSAGTGERLASEHPHDGLPLDQLLGQSAEIDGVTGQTPRLYTPEEAATILSGHPAPFSAHTGDVTPGGLRAAAHRRQIPFRLWRGKVRFTSDDLQVAILQAAVAAAAPPDPTPPARARGTTRSHRAAGRLTSTMPNGPAEHELGTRRRLTAKTAGHHYRHPAGEL